MTSLTDEPATKRRRVGASSSNEELPSPPEESPLQLRNRLLEENACAWISRELSNAGDFEDKEKERVFSEIAAVMRSAVAKLPSPLPSRLLAVPFAVLKNAVLGFLNIKDMATCSRVCTTIRTAASHVIGVACRKQAEDAKSTPMNLVQAGLCFQFTLHDHKAAFEAYRKAASAGLPLGMFHVGECYHGGIGTSCDREQGLRWFKRGSMNPGTDTQDLDDVEEVEVEVGPGKLECVAAVIAGGHTGWVPKQDSWSICGSPPCNAIVMLARAKLERGRADEWLLRAAATGDPRAQFEAAASQATDWPEAVRLYKLSAAAGFAPAHEVLGRLFARGKHVPRSAALALEHYRKAADAGISEAQYQAARLLARAGDHSAAAQYFKLAARNRHAESGLRLAIAMVTGQGVVQNVPRAIKWFEACAGGDDPYLSAEKSLNLPRTAVRGRAALHLGRLYAEGKHVPQDATKAFEWFRASVPWRTGIYEYAKCFETGFGTDKDEKKAATLYINAAEAGCILAMEALADRYARGACSLPKDEVKAKEWADKAHEKREKRGKKKEESQE